MTVLSAQVREAQTPDSQHADPDGGTLTYVFAIHEAGEAASAACAGYDGGSTPFHLALTNTPGGPWALAQDVPAAAFSEQALRKKLADPGTLEVFARTHHAMVTAAAVGGPVIPLPLATLYADRCRAAETLAARASQFQLALDRLRGTAEWAVKVYTTNTARGPADGAATSPRRPNPDKRGSQASPGDGRAYLDGIRARRQDQEAKQAVASAEAARVDEAVTSVARGAVRRRPHGTQVTGRHRIQILNGAYLVDTHRAEDLHSAIDALRVMNGIEIEVSGPWAPYSFAGLGCEET